MSALDVQRLAPALSSDLLLCRTYSARSIVNVCRCWGDFSWSYRVGAIAPASYLFRYRFRNLVLRGSRGLFMWSPYFQPRVMITTRHPEDKAPCHDAIGTSTVTHIVLT